MSEIDTLSIVLAKAPAGELPDMPIESDMITAGNPVARGAILTQSEDRKVSSGLWTCEPGEFDWNFTWDEFVYVLEGEVTITEEGGKSYTLGPNDMVRFPLGLKTHWKVTRSVRKFFVVRTPEPL